VHDIERLVEPLIPSLRRYARALVRDRSAADDLVHDCLERAVARWHQRRGDGDARTWLFAILHNLASNRLRQLQRRGPHVALDADADAALARPPAQDDPLRHRDLLRALHQLADDQRSVLLLIAVEDLSYAEAARVLGVPVGTVMSRLSRARDRLQRLMEGELPAAAPVALRSVP
jgi:RNA polymerase sigma-70 factor (ECF subfamily)